MKRLFLLPALLLAAGNIAAQHLNDSLQSQDIREVVVFKTKKITQRESKPLAAIDEYLQKAARVEMVKRGAYAWEPLINGLPSERTVITIDGMRIFGACTDKMDPITSYLEVSNLQEATISSGQQGNSHGSTIGGAIDLKRSRLQFGPERFNATVNTGFESVNQQNIFGADAQYRNEKFYTDVNFMSRDAENYKAGGNIEIPYSQFKKINISGLAGAKLSEQTSAEASVIYDKATDVGYPALPMDVSLAEALIISAKLRVQPVDTFVHDWETKVYYNTITHRMDDTGRPDVPIHMDMPGWNTTYGYYSRLKANIPHQQLTLNLNGFYNLASAEMTMYPADSGEKLMYMLTWPDVRTLSQTIQMEDQIHISDRSGVRLSAAAALQQNKITSEMGLNSLRIFYPEMPESKNRFLKSFSANYQYDDGRWQAGAGAGYGDRAPSVSEGYGFYLFNSSDKYDYIGNPDLRNESSWEANAFVGTQVRNTKLRLSSTYFHIQNYIAGLPAEGLLPMTIGANGVKVYRSLPYADVLNITATAEAPLTENLQLSAQAGYMRGRDDEGNNLPFMSPFTYQASLRYEKQRFSADVNIIGNSRQTRFATAYGETGTAAYCIVNAGAGYTFNFNNYKLLLRGGVENILDTQYTTFSDWNKILRPGRNLYLNLTFNL